MPLEELTLDDTVVVKTGEVVPVDGVIRDGFGMIDQHILTGESAPVEKGEGERVYAATVMLAGKIMVSVDKAGTETAAAPDRQDPEFDPGVQTGLPDPR